MVLDFQFNLKETEIYKAVVLEKNIFFKFRKIFKKLFTFFFFISFSFFLYSFFSETFPLFLSRRLLGFSILFLALSIIANIKNGFLEFLKKPKIKTTLEQAVSEPGKYNLAELLDFETSRAVFNSIKFAKAKKLSQINSSLLFYYLLNDNSKLNFVFSRALLSIKEIKKTLLATIKTVKKAEFKEIYSDNFIALILDALEIAKNKKHERIELLDVISSLAKNNLVFKEILINANLKREDIDSLVDWLEKVDKKTVERKKFFEWKNLIKLGSLGKEWATGYTVNLDKFSINLSERARIGAFTEMVGHAQETKAVERILAKEQENNVLLVGEAGSGRRIIIEDLAKKSVFGETLKELNYKRLIELDLASLLTQVQDSRRLEKF